MKKFFSFIFVFITVYSQAQDFGIGMWRDHLPYSNIIKVAKLDNLIYAASPYAVYTLDEEDETTDRITSVSGLSDFSISTIAVNTNQSTIIIGYENGNIDLIKNGSITNLNAILASNIVGDKRIYNIHSNGNFSYLACGFGIVVLDLSKTEVKDTYIIGTGGSQLRVNDITISDTEIIAATEEGIYNASISTPFLSDFNAWNKVTTFANNNDSYELVHFQNNLVYIGNRSDNFSDDTVKVLDQNYNELYKFDGDDFFAIEAKDNDVLMVRNYNILVYDVNFNEVENLYTYGFNTGLNGNDCFYDGNKFWIGDKVTGLNACIDNINYKNYLLQGPLNNKCFHMATKGDHLYVSAGRVEGSAWNNTYDASGVMIFDQYDWRVKNRDFDTNIDNTNSFDFVASAIDPKDETHVVYCSFYNGVYEFLDGNFVAHYYFDNSALSESLVHGPGQVKVGCAAIDKDGNIWAANSFATNPLVLITPEGNSYAFNIGSAGTNSVITSMLIEKSTNNIWLTIRGKGIVAYNFNNTPEDVTDDEYKLLTTTEGNGGLPSNVINCIAEDKDGEIWFGTENGPAVFYSPSSVFNASSNFDAQQVLIQQDGSFQYLLETQSISSIVVDGANRKWFGTAAGGIFLMSPDGTEEIEAFSVTNSPIFSNGILSLALNESSGELYIGTDKGIIGYRGAAIESKNSYEDIYCFPNPVKPGYTGPIAINGLKANSDVKITDSSGNLVFSTLSLGGQAIWYGKDLYGQDVVSGVYFVHIVAEDGQSKAHSKLLIIR
jgi:hypothetical protein